MKPLAVFLLLFSLSQHPGVQAQSLPDSFALWGEGTVGDKQIEMYLERRNALLTGWYRYAGHTGKLDLKSEATSEKGWLLTESWQGKPTGHIFISSWMDEPEKLEGEWRSGNGNKTLPFQLNVRQLRGWTHSLIEADVQPPLKLTTYFLKESAWSLLEEGDGNDGDTVEGYQSSQKLWFTGGNSALAAALNEAAGWEGAAPPDTNLSVLTSLPQGEGECESFESVSISIHGGFVAVLEMSSGGYCIHAAHPYHGSYFKCIDLRNGAQLSLGDIFTPQALAELQQTGYRGCEPGELSEEELSEISAQAFAPENTNFSLGSHSLSLYISFYDFHAGQACMYYDIVPEKEMLKKAFQFLAP